jgi:hypothetical protein
VLLAVREKGLTRPALMKRAETTAGTLDSLQKAGLARVVENEVQRNPLPRIRTIFLQDPRFPDRTPDRSASGHRRIRPFERFPRVPPQGRHRLGEDRSLPPGH